MCGIHSLRTLSCLVGTAIGSFPAICCLCRTLSLAPAPNVAMHGAQIVRRSNFPVNAASTPLVRSENRSSNVQVVVLIEAWQLTSPSELADGRQVTSDALCQICLPANRIELAGLLAPGRAECGKVCYRHYRKIRKCRKQRGRCRANPRIEITEGFTDAKR
jgi:hypothetical protein